MRKRIILTGIVLAAAASGGWYYYENYYKGKSAQTSSVERSVYINKVSDIRDQGALEIRTRLVGVVDPQE